jgi:DNA-directed RNA polymerase alpha subunit
MAMRYRAGGITYGKLAEQYGITGARARQIVMKIRQRTELPPLSPPTPYQYPDRLEDLPIRMAEVPIRVFNCLEQAGCKTVGDAMKMSEVELIGIRNFGRTSLMHWRDYLASASKRFPGNPGT